MTINDRRKQEIEALKAKDGLLMPEKVVEFAEKNPESALHSAFEWDDSEAARRYRLEQARQLIRVLVYIEDCPEGKVEVRTYVSLPSDRMENGGYRKMEAVLASKALQDELLKAALSDIKQFLAKYNRLCAVADVCEKMRELIKKHE